MPCHCTAAGKALLAWREGWREAVLEQPLESFTDRTNTGPESLRRELARTVARGYSIEDREYEGDTRGLAAPVFDETGEAMAALAVVAPVEQLQADRYCDGGRDAHGGRVLAVRGPGPRRPPSRRSGRHLKRAEPQPARSGEEIRRTVSEILADVERRGEAAVRDWSSGSTAGRPTRSSSARPRSTAAEAALDDDLKEHIAFAQAQVRAFAERQLETLRDLDVETLPGVRLGHRHMPVDAVGAYVPGGRYPMLASAFMTIVVPRVAGVEQDRGVRPAARRAWHPPGHAASRWPARARTRSSASAASRRSRRSRSGSAGSSRST